MLPFPEAFVYHDPLFGPYLEKTGAELISSATFEDDPELLAFLVPLPKGITVGISDVWRYFILYEESGIGILWRFLIFIIPPKHLVRQFSLVAREKLAGTYFSISSTKKIYELLRKNIERLPPWVWAVEMYADLSRFSNQEASAVWLFDATTRNISKPPHGLFAFCQHEVFNCWLEGMSVSNLVVRGPLRVQRNGISL